MAHHGTEDYDSEFMNEFAEKMNAIPSNELKDVLGPTGKFPDGKLNEKDEGELQFAMTVDKGNLIMNFGKPIIWIGFTKKEVNDLIYYLQEKVKEM